MYFSYQNHEELEDDLYQEDAGESEGSEANSELEFQLYSQLHYSSNAGELEEQESKGEKAEGQNNQQPEVTKKTADGDGEVGHTVEREPVSLDTSKLRQHLKKKKEKHVKQKKGESVSKGQRLSSSLFEEVIVIDSGPDIISISEDDTADDDGVCAAKGRGLQQLQTSTPALQGNLKRKRSFCVPVTLDSSSSESESKSEESESKSESDSYDSSDSDGLESWMILGPAKQDGDQCISLNLEVGPDSIADAEEEEGTWLVSDKDMEAQIYNKDRGARKAVQHLSNRYYTDKNVHCRNCNKIGHLSKNCPEPKKLSPCFLCGTTGHLAIECPNKHCNNCGLPGHLYGSCSERAYWQKQCHRCGMTGHFYDACPETWRQYHLTTKAGPPLKPQEEKNIHSASYCYNCGRKGHLGHECTRRRMFSGVYPTSPLIIYYDTMKDINRRKHRIKLRVKELKKKGCFGTPSQTPQTPGPLKKKQKISHHKNNQQCNQTPRQTPSSHKPSPSHIFFKDSDFKKTMPKTDQYKRYNRPESTGNVKPWKPKRPVPTSRALLPKTKLILDEADDFPRGGGKREKIDKNRKMRMRMRMKRKKETPAEGHRESRPDRLFCNVTREVPGSQLNRKQRRRNRRFGKKPAAPVHQTDENLAY